MDLKDEAPAAECEEGTNAQTSSDPDPMPTIEDYNFVPFQRVDKKTLQLVAKTLVQCQNSPRGETVHKVAEVLGLTLKYNTVPTVSGRPLIVISLVPTTPEMVYASYSYEEVFTDMLYNLRNSLINALSRDHSP